MNTIGDLIRDRNVYTVTAEQTVLEAVKFMVEKGIGAVAVLEGEKVVGIFSERDLMKRVVTKELVPKEVKVNAVMTRNMICAAPDETHDSCLAKMQQNNIRHLIIASGDRLVGVISLRDLMRIDIEEKSAEIEMMNAYLHYVPPSA